MATSPSSSAATPHQRTLLTRPLIRAEDVAALLAVRPSTVYELSRRRINPLPYVRVGRSKRFDPDAVADWIVRQTNR